MIKRKTTGSRNKRSSSKRNKQTSRSRPTRKSNNFSKFKEKVVGVIIMSILLTLIGGIYRPFILTSIFNCQCVDPEPGDFGVRLVFDAINLNHQLKENPNKKEELLRLLDEELVWFKKNRIQNKYSIKFYSNYDEFCFAEKPIYDRRDDIDRNYEMRFIGLHKHRKLGNKLVEIENYFARIVNGKITELYPVSISDLDRESFRLVNFVYRYYYIAVFLTWLIILSLTTYITNLPDYVFNFFRSILQKFGI